MINAITNILIRGKQGDLIQNRKGQATTSAKTERFGNAMLLTFRKEERAVSQGG